MRVKVSPHFELIGRFQIRKRLLAEILERADDLRQVLLRNQLYKCLQHSKSLTKQFPAKRLNEDFRNSNREKSAHLIRDDPHRDIRSDSFGNDGLISGRRRTDISNREAWMSPDLLQLFNRSTRCDGDIGEQLHFFHGFCADLVI